MALPAPNITQIIGIDQGFQPTWEAVVGAEKYRIYYRAAPSGSYLPYVEVVGGDVTTYAIQSLQNSVTYWVAIAAVEAGDVEGALSAPDYSVVTGSPIITEQPSGLVAEMKSGSIRLTWSAPAVPVDGYKVYYTTDKSDPRLWIPFSGATVDGVAFSSGDFIAAATEITLAGLVNNGGLLGNDCYYLQIVAIRNSVASAPSEEVVAVPLSNVADFITGKIVKIPMHVGYNIVSIPVMPSNCTTYGQFRTHMSAGGTIGQMFYLDGPLGAVAVSTGSTKPIVPGAAIFIVTSNNRARYVVGNEW